MISVFTALVSLETADVSSFVNVTGLTCCGWAELVDKVKDVACRFVEVNGDVVWSFKGVMGCAIDTAAAGTAAVSPGRIKPP